MAKGTMVVSVNMRRDESGRWWGESEDVFGLYVWKPTKRELVASIPDAIRQIMAANGLRITTIEEVAAPPKGIRLSKGILKRASYVMEPELAETA